MAVATFMGRLPPKEGICRKTAKTAVLTSSHSHWQIGLRSKACCHTEPAPWVCTTPDSTKLVVCSASMAYWPAAPKPTSPMAGHE
eukprot:scaffold46961_cov81-Phaeocystis_antarctica.AAC.6